MLNIEAKLRFANTSENTTKRSSRVLKKALKSKDKTRISKISAPSVTRTYCDLEIMSLTQ